MATNKNFHKYPSQNFENLKLDNESEQVTDSESEIIQSTTDTSTAQTSTSKSIIKPKKESFRKQDLIWNYYDEHIDPITKIKIVICKAMIQKENKEVKCGKEVTYNNSSGNM
ncbi:18493_t:CDS:1 [Dentiscutata erythropus]|uniref:18493_t:CDS:1 n=1 Tax=Dentiscutata erythropus TaxID=1348616 RepID=A0A9N9D514_9GLOM|nr:18493_t:CDS:1 [Dentiscutata erythropus]